GRLTHTLRPEWMMRRRRTSLVSFPVRGLHRRRQQVIHKAALKDVTALVVLYLLVKGGTESHRQAAVNLTLDNHRIDNVSAVVDGHKASYLDLARTFVNVDYTDVAPKRIGEIWWIVVVDCFESGFHPGWMIRIGRQRDLLNRLRAIGRTFDEEFSHFPFEVILVSLEQIGSNFPGLVFDLSASHGTGSSRDGRAATRIGSQSIWRGVRVTFLYQHVVDGKTKLLSDDLRVG